jgi:hypothetical protein
LSLIVGNCQLCNMTQEDCETFNSLRPARGIGQQHDFVELTQSAATAFEVDHAIAKINFEEFRRYSDEIGEKY